MAIDFHWNGKRWEAKKTRRKLTQYDHRGVAHYDRERMREPLAPIVHPREFDGYTDPPSWANIPDDWGQRDTLPAGYFHQCGIEGPAAVDALDDPPIAETAEYTLERCHVETARNCPNPLWRRAGEPEFIRRRALYRWELTFTDGATFRFVSRAIAESALSQLLKIRKTKHPRPRYAKHTPENACIFFTGRRLAKLQTETYVECAPAVCDSMVDEPALAC